MRSIRNNQVIVRKFKGKVSTVSPHMHVCMYVHPHAHNGANCMTFARSPVLSGANQNWPPWHGEWQCAVYGNPMLPSYWVPRTNLASTVRQIGPAEAFLLDPAAFAGMPQPAVVAVADQMTQLDWRWRAANRLCLLLWCRTSMLLRAQEEEEIRTEAGNNVVVEG